VTPLGEELLRKLYVLHWQELQTAGPALADSLRAIVEHTGPDSGSRA
jgi:hypothetical protein